MSVKLKNVVSGKVKTFPFIFAEKVLRVCDSLKTKPFVLIDKKFKYEGGQLYRVKPDIVEIAKDIAENDLNDLIKKTSKAKKYIVDKKIIKTIYIRNKIINYIVKN